MGGFKCTIQHDCYLSNNLLNNDKSKRRCDTLDKRLYCKEKNAAEEER